MTSSVRQGTAGMSALALASPRFRISLAIALILAAAIAVILAATAVARAAVLPQLAPGEARMGSLLLRDGERTVEAPRLATDIDITVSGPTARARVTQLFTNPTAKWVEAVYVNPLPDGGAVDTLKMVIGERIVVGEIKERKEAKAIYESAKRAGQKATLFEQERPNMFTNSVANIGPGETVLVQIEYQEPVRRSGNVSSLRVPLVVAPRYVPAPVAQTAEVSGRGWGEVSDPVPDRDRITPPVLDPAVEPPTNPVAITVRLNAGFAARRGQEPHPCRHHGDAGGRRAHRQARRPCGAGRPRLRADLDAGRDLGACRRACSASVSATRTTCWRW